MCISAQQRRSGWSNDTDQRGARLRRKSFQTLSDSLLGRRICRGADWVSWLELGTLGVYGSPLCMCGRICSKELDGSISEDVVLGGEYASKSALTSYPKDGTQLDGL